MEEWIQKAALLVLRSPSMTRPSSSMSSRSLTRILEKCTAYGLTQNLSGNSGSRAVMCPAMPSS